MNKHFFTLTELLMAIGIIVILAAIAIPTTASAIKKAEQAKAQAQMTELVNALKNYENTYGSLPVGKILKELGVPVASQKDGTLSLNGKLEEKESEYSAIYEGIIKVLQGQNEVEIKVGGVDKTFKLNPRKTQFLEVQANEEGEFLDPWGNIFYIVFDVTGDGKIDTTQCCPYGLKLLNSSGSEITTLRKDLVIWSKGPDGKHYPTSDTDDDHPAANADNVFSIPVDYDKANKYFTPSR